MQKKISSLVLVWSLVMIVIFGGVRHFTTPFEIIENGDYVVDARFGKSPTAGVTKITYTAAQMKERLDRKSREKASLTAGVTKALNDMVVEKRFMITVQGNYADRVGAAVEPVITIKEKEASGTKYVKASSLNMRERPDADSEVLNVIPFGKTVETKTLCTVIVDGVKQDGKWYKISYNNQIGYVASEYLTDSAPERSLGYYRITYYCPCNRCCGGWANGITASGATAVEGVTIAADPSIPMGTKIRINGHVYTVQDRGGAIRGKHIDIYMNSHSKALAQTYTYGEVFEVVLD